MLVIDAHCHIIDPRFPLVGNNGYVPEAFDVHDYLERVTPLGVSGGVVVAGSFQGNAQDYLIAALRELGDGYVGVTQLPADVSDERIRELDAAGIRAVRFNLYRGPVPSLSEVSRFAHRVYEVAGWHSEFYLDAQALPDLAPMLRRLPAATIDHLAMSDDATGILLTLVEHGLVIKATGFGRMSITDPDALMADVLSANPRGLVFGTDLPSTRAAIPFQDGDLDRVLQVAGAEHADAVVRTNAIELYRLGVAADPSSP